MSSFYFMHRHCTMFVHCTRKIDTFSVNGIKVFCVKEEKKWEKEEKEAYLLPAHSLYRLKRGKRNLISVRTFMSSVPI